MATRTVRARFDKGVLLYLRVSTETQSDERQQTTVPRYAQERFPEAPTRVVRDQGVSAFKTSLFDRPGGRELVGLIQSGEYRALVVDSQDRLSRGRQSEWWTFFDLCREHDVEVHTVKDGPITDDEAGEVIAALRQSLARRESAEKAHRAIGGASARAEGGYWVAGRPPTACRLIPAPDGSRHKILSPTGDIKRVARAFELVDAGHTIRAAATETRLSPTKLSSRILRNRHYAGQVWHAGAWWPAKWEPMLDLACFERVQRLLDVHQRERGGKPRHHPFGRILRCQCGAGLVHRLGRGVYLYYRCQRHCGISAAAENLEASILAYLSVAPTYIRGLLETDDWQKLQRSATEADELAQTLAAKEAELSQLVRLAARGGALGEKAVAEAETLGAEIDHLRNDHRTLTRDSATIRADLERLQEALRFGATDESGIDSAIITWWSQATVEQKRTAATTIFDRIELDTNTIRLSFNHGLPPAIPVPFDAHKRTEASDSLRELGFGKSTTLGSKAGGGSGWPQTARNRGQGAGR